MSVQKKERKNAPILQAIEAANGDAFAVEKSKSRSASLERLANMLDTETNIVKSIPFNTVDKKYSVVFEAYTAKARGVDHKMYSGLTDGDEVVIKQPKIRIVFYNILRNPHSFVFKGDVMNGDKVIGFTRQHLAMKICKKYMQMKRFDRKARKEGRPAKYGVLGFGFPGGFSHIYHHTKYNVYTINI